MNKELAVIQLKMVKEVFDRFGIKFWLDGGTLLGAIREGKIIDWDNDIDLGMWSCDLNKLFLAICEIRRKFELRLGSPLFPNKQWVKLSLYPFDFDIDIWLWQAKDDKIFCLYNRFKGSRLPINSILYILSIARHYLFCDFTLFVPMKPIKFIAEIFQHSLPLLPLRLKTFLLRLLQPLKLGYTNWILINPKSHFEKLETTKFYGMEFYIPCDVEGYLKYHYGDNWRVPQKKWEWTEDDLAPILKE
ncbi:MAG: LicD family protein [Candidatus Jordarchaeaceae archaeon]